MKHAEKIEKIKNGKPFGVFDIVFLAVILTAVIIGCYFAYWKPAPGMPNAVVVCYQDGVKAGEYRLSEDREVVLGDGALVLVIEKSVAYVKESHCPDHLCERILIDRVNQKIVCLPQKIVIFIEGESEFHFYT